MTYPKSESQTTEFMEVSSDTLPSDLWEVVSAFANADGGTIYLGIKSNSEVVGIDIIYHDKLIRDLNTLCSSAFNHKIYPEINITEDQVIKAYIPPVAATMRPIYSSKRALPKGGKVRVGTSNVSIDDEWMRRFARAANGGAELSEFDADYHEYFLTEAIERYLEAVKEKRGDVYRDLDEEVILKKLRAITSEKKITLFGLLAFSNSYGLQELTAPTVNIAVTHYAGTSKVNPTDISEVSLDDKEYDGNVPYQFENALNLILSKMPVRSSIADEGKRQSDLAIPKLAIRETLANALGHRDYSTYRSRVQVDIYADRVEFANPGRSLVPIEDLEKAHPQTRNPLLMNYLKDLRIVEHRGRGIKTIINSLKDAGLAEPSFEHRHDWFVATLYSSAFIQDSDQDWLKQFQKYGLNERQLKALVHAKHNPSGISNTEYRQINNMNEVGDDRKANLDLVKLADLQILKKVGANRNRRYVYSEDK